MFLKPETLNPTMKITWSKTSSQLWSLIHDSITTAKANLIFWLINQQLTPVIFLFGPQILPKENNWKMY